MGQMWRALWISYWYVYYSFAPFWRMVVLRWGMFCSRNVFILYSFHDYVAHTYIQSTCICYFTLYFTSTSGTPSQTIVCWPNLNVWRRINLYDRDRLSRAVRKIHQLFMGDSWVKCSDPGQTIACCQQMILKRPQYTDLVKFFKLFSHIVLRRGVMSEIYPYWRRLLHTSFSLVYTSFYITVVFRAKRRYFRTKIIEDDMFTRKDKRPGGRGCMNVYLNDRCRQVYMISSLFIPETPFW
jgi:hypothetical protein